MPKKYIPKTKPERALEIRTSQKAGKKVDFLSGVSLPKDTLTREEYYRVRA